MLCILPFATLLTNASAAIIAYDGFESYTSGSNLNGGSGGSYWTTDWTTFEDDTTIQSFALTDPTGNVSSGSQAARLRSTAIHGDIGNFMSRGFTDQTSTVYFSFLLRVDETVGDVDNADFYSFQVSNGATGNNSSTLGVGIRNTSGNPLFARVGSSANITTNASTNATADTTFLIVAKFSKDGSANYNRTDLYINPAGPTEPGTADATAIYSGTGINTLSLFTVRNFQPELNDTVYIDELRFATTFAEAITVPEPSSALLVAIGIFTLLHRRRHP